MVMLFRTLLFPVDNGMDNHLVGDGLAVEYDLWTGRVIWRRLGDSGMTRQKKIAATLMGVSSVLSPIVVAVFVILVRRIGLFDLDTNTKIFQLAPFMIGGIAFLGFELLMLILRSFYPRVHEVPSMERQQEYFVTMYNNTIRENSVFSQYKTPFIGTYIAFGLALAITPFAYNFYLQPDSFGDYLMGLFSVSILVSLAPQFLWNILLKHLIYIKLIRKTKGKQ